MNADEYDPSGEPDIISEDDQKLLDFFNGIEKGYESYAKELESISDDKYFSLVSRNDWKPTMYSCATCGKEFEIDTEENTSKLFDEMENHYENDHNELFQEYSNSYESYASEEDIFTWISTKLGLKPRKQTTYGPKEIPDNRPKEKPMLCSPSEIYDHKSGKCIPKYMAPWRLRNESYTKESNDWIADEIPSFIKALREDLQKDGMLVSEDDLITNIENKYDVNRGIASSYLEDYYKSGGESYSKEDYGESKDKCMTCGKVFDVADNDGIIAHVRKHKEEQGDNYEPDFTGIKNEASNPRMSNLERIEKIYNEMERKVTEPYEYSDEMIREMAQKHNLSEYQIQEIWDSGGTTDIDVSNEFYTSENEKDDDDYWADGTPKYNKTSTFGTSDDPVRGFLSKKEKDYGDEEIIEKKFTPPKILYYKQYKLGRRANVKSHFGNEVSIERLREVEKWWGQVRVKQGYPHWKEMNIINRQRAIVDFLNNAPIHESYSKERFYEENAWECTHDDIDDASGRGDYQCKICGASQGTMNAYADIKEDAMAGKLDKFENYSRWSDVEKQGYDYIKDQYDFNTESYSKTVYQRIINEVEEPYGARDEYEALKNVDTTGMSEEEIDGYYERLNELRITLGEAKAKVDPCAECGREKSNHWKDSTGVLIDHDFKPKANESCASCGKTEDKYGKQHDKDWRCEKCEMEDYFDKGNEDYSDAEKEAGYGEYEGDDWRDNIPAGTKHCEKCGRPLMSGKKCDNCGTINEGGRGSGKRGHAGWMRSLEEASDYKECPNCKVMTDQYGGKCQLCGKKVPTVAKEGTYTEEIYCPICKKVIENFSYKDTADDASYFASRDMAKVLDTHLRETHGQYQGYVDDSHPEGLYPV